MSSSQALANTTREGSGAMFDGIAQRYDLLNRFMSLGLDQSWRRKAIRALQTKPGDRILDLATGTGDLAIRVLKRHKNATVFGLDPSSQMLSLGREKCERNQHTLGRFRPLLGDASKLPFATNTFNGVCIGFGIRNFPDRAAALQEIARVTRPEGRVSILELSEPQTGLLAPLVRFHIRQVVPLLGALLSGSKEYRYLQRSIAAFPPPKEFAALMESSGISPTRTFSLTFGVCHLYTGMVSQEGP